MLCLLLALLVATCVPLAAGEDAKPLDPPARVTSGRELALALVNATAGGPDVVLLAAGQVNLTSEDWSGIPLPLVLPAGHSLTIRGSPDLPTGFPVLRMPTLQAVKLLDNATFTLENLVLDHYVQQKASFMRTPSLSILTPSPEGTRGARVIIRDAGAINAFCLPWETWEQNVAAAVRPPALLPGVQRYQSNIDQGSCVNGTSSPPMNRCWPSRYLLIDVGGAGAQLNPSGNPVPTHYDFQLLNIAVLCPIVVDRSCVASLGPLGCMLLYERGVAGAFLPGSTSPPPPSAGAQEAAGGSGGGSDGPSPLMTGCIVGGVLLFVILVALAAFLLLRRSKAKRAHMPPPSTDLLHSSQQECPKSSSIESTTTRTATATSEECGKGGYGRAYGTTSCPAEGTAVLCGAGSPLPDEGRLASAVVVSDLTPLASVAMDLRVDMELDPDGRAPSAEGACLGGAAGSSLGPDSGAPAEPSNVVRLTGVVLGKGTFGRVYEGVYQGRLVAVKQLLEGPSDAAPHGVDKAHETYRQELEVLGRCNHPNIVKVLAACVVDTARPVMVLERMDTSLDKVLYGSTDTQLPLRLVLHIALQVAQGLSYLHPTILHRDLKPANVLISDPYGAAPLVKLSDFGLSRLRHTILRTDRPEAGTPAYMSPECFDIKCKGITHRTDCYAFGVLLWEMLAGTQPWHGKTSVQIACEVALLGHRLPVPPPTGPGGGSDVGRWPQRLRTLLTACFERDPMRRPAAAEIVKALALAFEDLDRAPSSRPSPGWHGPAALKPVQQSYLE